MNVRALAVAAALAIATAGGWLTRGWFEDAQRLTEERAARLVTEAAMAREAGIAGAVEDRLAELDANQRIIDRGVIREIHKPIYRRVCHGDDAIRLLNDAAAGRAPDPAEPHAQVSGNAAPAD